MCVKSKTKSKTDFSNQLSAFILNCDYLVLYYLPCTLF